METSSNDNLQAVCTVSELAKKLDLSRARFYQLQKTGVFPTPLYCVRTKHPFYPLDLQQLCVNIRRTGIDCNGQPIIFYSRHKSESRRSQKQSDSKYEELATALREMGLNVTRNDIRKVAKALYPDGLAKGPIDGAVIGKVFRYLSNGGQNSV